MKFNNIRTFGEQLKNNKLITEEEILQALSKKINSELLGETLIRLELIDRNLVISELEEYFKLKYLSIDDIEVNKEALKLFTSDYYLNNSFFPYSYEDRLLKIITTNPKNEYLISEIKNKLFCEIELNFCQTSDINNAHLKYGSSFNSNKSLSGDFFDNASNSDTSPVINLVNKIIRDAGELHASDIHIDPQTNEILVKYRIDGILKTYLVLNKELHNKIVNRIKVMSKLDISEVRLPQDGRFKTNITTNESDLRVSILPTINGEKVVLRLLYLKKSAEDFEVLGFNEHYEKLIRNSVERQHGIILLSGPTGSGKSTTLYAMLNVLKEKNINIVTVEDPVEMRVDGINQIQVKEELGLTFANSLRSILRQDPDVIMIGEIRDSDTATIAIRSSLTGHLVLSTIHTNSAIEIISRLVDMGVERFLLANALSLLVSQRLVRKLCKSCAIKTKTTDSEKALFKTYGYDTDFIYKANGCEKCNNTGYIGRIAVVEIIEVDKILREMIVSKKSINYIIDNLSTKNTMFIIEDGLQKVINGTTSLEEIFVHIVERNENI